MSDDTTGRTRVLTLSTVSFTVMFAVWLMFGILETLIALRILLKLIGANPGSPIAMLIYALVAWAVERVIWLIFYRPRGPVVEVTRTTNTEHHTNTR